MRYSHKFPEKDPQAILDYKVDLLKKGWLAAGETITAEAVTCPDTTIDISLVSSTDTSILFWLTGGTAGVDYFLTAQFTTSAGRTDQRTMLVPVRER